MAAKQEKLPPVLTTLDATKGGIAETGEVKNRDKLLVYEGQIPYLFLQRVWSATEELIKGEWRTILIMRKDAND